MSAGGYGRLPAAPAQQALRGFAHRHGIRIGDLAEVLAVDAQLLDSVMQRRWLPWPMADIVAVALRCHPSSLWPEWFRPASDTGRTPDRLAQQITSTKGP